MPRAALLVLLAACVGPAPESAVATRSLALHYADGTADRFSYRLLLPPPGAGEGPFPLVVYLHGAGSRGSDNAAHLTWLPRTMMRAENRRRFPCYLLAVQCRADRRWVEAPWDGATSTPMRPTPGRELQRVIAALDQTLAVEDVDPDRVYLTGLSMGGFGAWELAARRPGTFAAVVPVCGGGDERQAERIAHLPVWAFHGAVDRVVPVERSRAMVAALRDAGGKPRYTEIPDGGHDAWKVTYGPDGALEWMFAQRR